MIRKTKIKSTKQFKATRPIEYYVPHPSYKIPGHYFPDATSPDGWRFVATDRGWKLLTQYGRDHISMCLEAGDKYHIGTEWHHVFGRGAAKRHDRIEVGEITYLEWLCRADHDAREIRHRLPSN